MSGIEFGRRGYLPIQRDTLRPRLYTGGEAARENAAHHAEVLLGVQNLRHSAARLSRDNEAVHLRFA